MTPEKLYETVVINNPSELISFLNESNAKVRLTFLQAQITDENTGIFQQIIRALAQKNLSSVITLTNEIQSLYIHLAYYFKKANNRAFVDACTTHIQETVFKKRLSAWLHYKRYINKASHITEFRNYLTKLSAARIDEDDDYTYEILSDLYEYKTKIVNKLPEPIHSSLIDLFTNGEMLEDFPILNQFVLEGLEKLPNFEVVEYKGKEYIPSEFAGEIFAKHFVDYVKGNSLFGYDIIEATEQIIKKGQARFDDGYNRLTPSDVVKIYCYCNMRMHYYSSLCLYERSEIVPKFYNTNGRIKFIDIGCGPATSGLAFAEYIYDSTGEPASFDYFGIDMSIAMQEQANEIMTNDVFLESNYMAYYKDIKQIDVSQISSASCIIINACYVFASPSLNLKDITDFILDVKSKYPYAPKFLLFQNPIGFSINKRYEEFKKLLQYYKIIYTKNEEIKYYNQRKWTDYAKVKGIYYEILKL